MCNAKRHTVCVESIHMRLFYFDTEKVNMFTHLVNLCTFNYKSLQAATLKTFKSLERNELIFFWHHVQVNKYTVIYLLYYIVHTYNLFTYLVRFR